MGRPVEIDDDEIVAAGIKLRLRGTVNGTRLWQECGQKGRPARLLDVWLKHHATERSPGGSPASDGLPIPDHVRSQASTIKNGVAQGIDRALAAIYHGVEDAVKNRYQQEIEALDAARREMLCETQEALEALGEIGDERDRLAADVHSLEVRTQVLEQIQAANVALLEAARSVAATHISEITNLQISLVERDVRCQSAQEVSARMADELTDTREKMSRAVAQAAGLETAVSSHSQDVERMADEICLVRKERDNSLQKNEEYMARALTAEQTLRAMTHSGPSPTAAAKSVAPPAGSARKRNRSMPIRATGASDGTDLMIVDDTNTDRMERTEGRTFQ
jgi:chemotaxis protein histidine kinase CheA